MSLSTSSPSPLPNTFLKQDFEHTGADCFFASPREFNLNFPPYRLSSNDVEGHQLRPLFPLAPEDAPRNYRELSEDDKKSLYFFQHPAIIRLLPFVRLPRRIPRVKAEYLVDLLNRAIPVFQVVSRAYPDLPHTPVQNALIGGLLEIIRRVRQSRPSLQHPDWHLLCLGRDMEHWLNLRQVPFDFHFPGIQEFSALHPQLPAPLSPSEHSCLKRIRSGPLVDLMNALSRLPTSTAPDVPNLVSILHNAEDFIASIGVEFADGHLGPAFTYGFFNSTRVLVSCLPPELRDASWLEAIPPPDPAFEDVLFPRNFEFPSGLHESLKIAPFPFWNESPNPPLDPLQHFWRQPRLRRACGAPMAAPGAAPEAAPVAVQTPIATGPSRAPTPSTTPRTNALLPPLPITVAESSSRASPRLQDIASYSEDAPAPVRNPTLSPAPQIATLEFENVAASPSYAPMSEPPADDALTRRIIVKPVSRAASSKRASRPPAPTGLRRSHRKPQPPAPRVLMTATPSKSSTKPSSKRKRTATPPAVSSEASGSEFEPPTAEVEPDEDEEDQGKAVPEPSPAPPFPPVKRRVRGTAFKTRVEEAPPPRDAGNFENFQLACEAQLMHSHPPLLFEIGCSNCLLRKRKCDENPAPGQPCEVCRTDHIAHCSHGFNTAEHIEMMDRYTKYTRLSHSAGSRHLTDFITSRLEYDLARSMMFRAATRMATDANRLGTWLRSVKDSFGPMGLPGMLRMPEELRPAWQAVLDRVIDDFPMDFVDNIPEFANSFAYHEPAIETDEEFERLLEHLRESSFVTEEEALVNASTTENAKAGPSNAPVVNPSETSPEDAISTARVLDFDEAALAEGLRDNMMDTTA
ncbi:hypothetical protein B0H12DRAFT_1230217 [Mycena haematopus]|nr:hypothetical protein B0H12DRAFT_1230217 [Mycena haematopus]